MIALVAPSSGLAGVLPLLACPVCRTRGRGSGLAVRGAAVGCDQGHRFDVARPGYLTLIAPRGHVHVGDTAEMVAARGEFLGAGYFGPIADAVAEAVAAGPVLDVGAGPGWYLDRVLRALADRDHGSIGGSIGIALDASRFAARRAAGVPGVGAVVADAWTALPLLDGACATATCVFAPRDLAELARVLRPGGRLVAVTPRADHLVELRQPLGLLSVSARKAERLELAAEAWFAPADARALRYPIALSRSSAVTLARMGPAAHHHTPEWVWQAASALAETTTVTVDVRVTTLVRR